MNSLKDADAVFEISYEICNKVGGIYTAVSSKAREISGYYGDKYYAIGFFNPAKSKIEFDEKEIPEEFEKVFKNLEKHGIKCHYGVWLIPGRPNTVLIDSSQFIKHVNEIKTDLWNKHKVDSINSDDTFNEPVAWSTAVGMLLTELLKTNTFKNLKCVAHFHEWLSGAGLLYLKENLKNTATVFTTHATTLGRVMAGADIDIFRIVEDGIKKGEIASLDMARQYGVIDRHTMELACANNADIFTTVSSVTANEAEYILGRKPDLILPNGIDLRKFPTAEEIHIMRKKYRKQTREFFTAYFSRYYDIDLEKIRSIFISGRYEFHNKGIDLFIDALGKLNERLKKEKSEKIAVAFIFIPAKIKGENIMILKNIALYEGMEDNVDNALPDIKEKILNLLTGGKIPENINDILTDEFLQTYRRMMEHFTETRGLEPPLSAFDLSYPEQNDLIIRSLRNNNLLNRKEDRVKVIFYPTYLSSADRLLTLEYEQAVLTCDLGVFPSYYEPWGYTPLESAAMGILAITTDMTGFGKFIEGKGNGVYVLKREHREWKEIVEDLANRMYEVVALPADELAKHRIDAKETAALADWKILVKNYIKAHNLALKKVGK